MTRVLHIHAGLPKCGSSSLQQFLFRNHAGLRAAGFAYPLLAGKAIGNLTPFLRSYQTPQEAVVFLHNNPGFDPQRARRELAAALRDTATPNVILSGEGFSRFAQEMDLDFIMEGFDRVIIHLFFRARAAWLLSHHAQGVKTGKYACSFSDFIGGEDCARNALPTLRFADHLAFWHAGVGAAQVRVHLLSRDRPSPPAQLLDALGVDLPEEALADAHRNAALSAFQTCLMACVARDTRRAFLQVAGTVRKTAARCDTFEDRTLLAPHHVAAIDDLLAADTDRFMSLQDAISRAELRSETPRGKSPVEFAEMCGSAAFARARALLSERGITVRAAAVGTTFQE